MSETISDQTISGRWVAPRLVSLTSAGASEGGSLMGYIEDYMITLMDGAMFNGYGPS